MEREFDYDWIVDRVRVRRSVVSALRLAEKGYRVGVLECGRRFEDADYAKSTWNLRRYYWMPQLGLRGILRLTVFKDILVASGCGVGGGSLGYANTLYRARPAFFEDPQWGEGGDWERELAPHYDEAERMLGVAEYPLEGPADVLLKEYGEHDRRRRHLQARARRRLLRRAGPRGRGPLLRRRGPGPLRLHRLRQLHGRLPLQRQEHAAQELPLVRREARGGDPSRAAGRGRPAARSGRRLRRIRGHEPPLGRRCCGGSREPSRRAAWSSPRGRSAPTSCWPTASTAARSRGSRTGSDSSSGPTASRSTRSPRPATSATSPSRSRSAPASTRTPTPTSRSSPTGSGPTR